jgi:membrane protease YdiL (CAAX protease family)
MLALGILFFTGGADAVKRELRTRLSMRSGLGILVMAAAIPLIVGTVAIGVARASGDGAPFIPPAAVVTSIFVQTITGGTGEELGWRGFLLPRLRARIGSTGAAVAMSLLWALWHVPAFYTPGMPHQSMPMGPMLSLTALFGVFLAALF